MNRIENNSTHKLVYFKPLDGVRAIAILMVMFFHLKLNLNSDILLSIKKIGQTGVTLFFILSGFLITRILIETKNHEKYFFNFYARRILRIFPLYYLFLIIYFFVLPAIDVVQECSLQSQLPFYLYYQNISMTFNFDQCGPNHYWSLAVEEHFYFLWPIIVYLTSIEKLNRAILILIIISLISKVVLIFNGFGTFYFTICRMDALAIGCYLAVTFHQKEGIWFVNWKKIFYWTFAILVLFGILWFNFSGKGNDFIQIIKDWPYQFIFCILLLSIISSNNNSVQNKIRKILSNQLLGFIGKISFGLYVFHPACYLLVEKMKIQNTAFEILTSVALSFLIATVSFYAFENNFLKLKKHFN